MRALRVAAALVPLVAAAAPPPKPAEKAPEKPAALEGRREAVARALVRLGAELQREVERRDVAALVARVPAGGLRCGDRTIPKERVAKDLRTPTTWLHGVFFGGPGYAPPQNTPASLAALFASAREIAVLVTFEDDPRAGPVGRPCIDFRVQGVGTPGAPICFEERGGRWWFTESLYPCG